MTPSQIQIYSRMAYFRRDEEKKFKEEMAIMAAGGDAREYTRKRKTLREVSMGERSTSNEEQTSRQFLEMASRAGISIKRENIG